MSVGTNSGHEKGHVPGRKGISLDRKGICSAGRICAQGGRVYAWAGRIRDVNHFNYEALIYILEI